MLKRIRTLVLASYTVQSIFQAPVQCECFYLWTHSSLVLPFSLLILLFICFMHVFVLTLVLLFRYEWRLLSKGKEVMLGEYPTGWVRRLASWGWAVCNVNIVCLSVEPGVDGEPEAVVPAVEDAIIAAAQSLNSASEPRARDRRAAAAAEQEDTGVGRPEKSRELSATSSTSSSSSGASSSSSSSNHQSSAVAPSKVEANQHLFDEEPYGSDDLVQVVRSLDHIHLLLSSPLVLAFSVHFIRSFSSIDFEKIFFQFCHSFYYRLLFQTAIQLRCRSICTGSFSASSDACSDALERSHWGSSLARTLTPIQTTTRTNRSRSLIEALGGRSGRKRRTGSRDVFFKQPTRALRSCSVLRHLVNNRQGVILSPPPPRGGGFSN